MPSRILVRVLCAAALVAGVAAGASAQPYDKRTHFAFSAPFAVPGVTLPAGEYLFRLADSHGRDVVQVLSADGRTPYAMFFALQTYRSEPARDPEIRFMETAEGIPPAIKIWWYPGYTGYEFVYSREQARRFATRAGAPVLAAGTPAPAATPEVAWVAEEEAISVLAPIERPRVEAGLQFEEAPARTALPNTDAPTILVLLAALALLSAAAVVRAVRISQQ